VLAGSPHLRQFVRLDLDHNQIGPEGALALARSANFASLTILNIASNRIGTSAMEKLLTSPGLPCLADVDLSEWARNIDIDMLGSVFAGPTGARLTRLVLDDHRFGDAIFSRLAPLRLRFLRLEYCSIGPEGGRTLAEMPLLESLRELDLGCNKLGDAGVTALVQSPRTGNLRRLRLSGNDLGAAGTEAVASSPHLARLRELELNGNQLGNAGAKALAASTHLNHLISLRLHGNRIFKSMKPELQQRFGDAVSL
jgi:Ran GTPase-activating protein (RanGAP) involved in mRNA processing and transport